MTVAGVLELESLSVAYAVPTGRWGRRRPQRVVDAVDLHVDEHEIVGLVGESGSGKSTTARGALRLVPIESGRARLDGVDITDLSERALRPLRKRAQMVFQDPYSSLDPGMTVAQLVGEALELVGRLSRAERRRRVREVLAQVGLSGDQLDRYPHEFSGGQRQRIAIARALAPQPRLVVCDEAVSALDVSTQNQILTLLKRLRDDTGTALLFIAHDLAVVRKIADRTVVMYCGTVVETGPTRQLFAAPQHPYTVALLSAVPVASPTRQRQRRRILLTGDPPNPLDPPAGCRFHTRCPFVMDRCRTERPPLRDTEGGGTVRCHLHDEPGPLPWTHVGAVPLGAAAAGTIA